MQGEGDVCKTEQFRVLDDGTNGIMERGTYFCGQGPIYYESQANVVSFGNIQIKEWPSDEQEI